MFRHFLLLSADEARTTLQLGNTVELNKNIKFLWV
jgi:hypothetical protein